ncbi:MAG: ABC transporter substrate-binding protein, partial [Candidatus Thorarchaeota archaeon]
MTLNKTPLKTKLPKIKKLKKPIIVGGLIASIAIAGIISGIIVIILGGSQPEVETHTLIFGYIDLPRCLDPLEVKYDADTHLLYQIAEGLFDFDENGNIKNNLAVNHNWSSDYLNLTCFLREDVYFHDGTPFNATSVKWNFDRIYKLLNNISYPDLWLFTDRTPIINDTQVIDDYIIKFVLNRPFVPFESLLAIYCSFIISPTSTPDDRFLDIDTEKTIGTGPFIFEKFNPLINISLSANSNYWGGKPEIDTLLMTNSSDFYSGTALLSDEIDLAYSYSGFDKEVLNIFRTNSSFIVETEPTCNLRWLVMNNNLINVTMRKAISYALNYSLIESFGNVSRAKSPIPDNILYHDITGIDVPYYNLSIARQALKNVNWNNTAGALIANDNISTGNEWESLVDNGTPLAIYNYTYVEGILHMSELVSILTENLKQIGVRVEPFNVSRNVFWAMKLDLYGYHRNMFHFTYDWWIADYNDPCNFINSLFTNESVAENAGQTNDHLTQTWMTEALSETNRTTRKQLYYNIQKHLIEEVYPIAFSYSTTQVCIYRANLKGWKTNSWTWPFKN